MLNNWQELTTKTLIESYNDDELHTLIMFANGYKFHVADKYMTRAGNSNEQKLVPFNPDDDFAMGTTTEEGSGEVCGRKTNRFKVDLGFGYNFGGYSMSMSEATFYDFDQETGICLASSTNENVNVMGMNSGDDEDEGFECIRFELNKVTLPTVD